jgi:hypothetical protein
MLFSEFVKYETLWEFCIELSKSRLLIPARSNKNPNIRCVVKFAFNKDGRVRAG